MLETRRTLLSTLGPESEGVLSPQLPTPARMSSSTPRLSPKLSLPRAHFEPHSGVPLRTSSVLNSRDCPKIARRGNGTGPSWRVRAGGRARMGVKCFLGFRDSSQGFQVCHSRSLSEALGIFLPHSKVSGQESKFMRFDSQDFPKQQGGPAK